MESSPSPASASGSQSILCNVDKSSVIGKPNVINNDNDNVVVTALETDNNSSVINNVDEVDDLNSLNCC